jgi:hypothetical protein
MPAVLAEVKGDTVGAPKDGFGGSPDRVRLIGLPGLPDRRYVIDVDA